MHRDPVTVTPDDTLAHALRITRRHRIRHLPVVLPAGDVVGILSDRDIRLAMPSPLTTVDGERTDFLERTPVAAIMTREVITAAPGDSIEDAAQLLYRHRIGSLPVVDDAGALKGILTETDILHAFLHLLGGAESSSRLEIALPDRPGELARAIQIVGGDLKLNIVSVVVAARAEQRRKRAIVHVATIDPREAVQALEKAGFEVGWPSLEGEMRGAGKGA
ncbi:MAG TPA: CBS and ACT domain-containing protein [Longimicrobiaceae bacterium]|nr:CBS and ACT domain-containing protein [Longimicrobiaceae bacterium]